MKEFDRKIKELSKNIEIPEEYDRKVDKLLDALPEKEPFKTNRRMTGRIAAILAVCFVCVIIFFNIGTLNTEANIFESFKTTILDFIKGSGEENSEELGLDSSRTSVADKRALRMELQEMVISSHDIYLLVRITASSDVHFTEDIAFEYFAFSTGESFNSDDLLGGATDCKLVEVMEGKPNIALYAVTLSSDDVIEDGSKVTAYFENLAADPYSNNPVVQVEGIWNISFSADYTVRDTIEIGETEEIEIPFLETTATVESVEISPLGLVMVTDVSKAPYDELGISDTTIELRLKMLDGEEMIVDSRKEKEKSIIQSGSRSYNTVEEKTTQKDVYEFEEPLDINKVAGIYIEDVFFPAN